jgi:hypothetical protein
MTADSLQAHKHFGSLPKEVTEEMVCAQVAQFLTKILRKKD